jgi:hypothetical protein
MSRNLLKLDRYREQNEQAARIILADVAKYGGQGALVVLWARQVIQGSDSLVAKTKARAGLDPAGQSEQKGAA